MKEFGIVLFLFLLGFVIPFIIIVKHKIEKRKFKISYSLHQKRNIFYLRLLFLFIANIFCFISFFDITYGYKSEYLHYNYIDNVILLDYSTSMLAQDVTPTRFEFAKNLIEYFIKNFLQSRFCVIIFSSDPILEIPFTDNIDFILSVIRNLQLTDQYYRTSLIDPAIQLGISLLEKSPSQIKNIFIFSDFEFFDTLSANTVYSLKNKNINVNALITATKNGSTIMIPSKNIILKDAFNTEVISKPNETWISTNLSKFNSHIFEMPSLSLDSLNKMTAKHNNEIQLLKEEKIKSKQEIYYIFTIAAIICLVGVFIIYMPFKSLNLNDYRHEKKTDNTIF